MLNEFRSTSITWDKATRRIYSPITANGSDSNGRKLNIQVVNSGQVENLTGATLHLYWETKDKAQHGLDAFTASDISKGEFELFYTTGMLSNVGELNATLVLVDSTGKVVSDWFKITVARGIDGDAIQSENSFTTLTQALIDISNLEKNYAPRLNDLTAQLQQIAINVLEKGAKGDGLTDDTLAIQSALDTGHTVLIPKGVYLIDGTRVTIPNVGDPMVAGLLVKSNQTVIFEKGAILKAKPTASEWYSLLGIYKVENVQIVNGHFLGERDEHVGTTGEFGYGVNIQSSVNVTISDCIATDFWGDGFFVGTHNHTDSTTRSRNVQFLNCQSDNNRRQGLSVTGAIDVLVQGGEYVGTNGTEPSSGIDLEANHPSTLNENITIRDVNLSNNGLYGVMATQNKNVLIDNCNFSGNKGSGLYVTADNDIMIKNCFFDEERVLHLSAITNVDKFITFKNCNIKMASDKELMSATSAPAYSGEVNWINNEFTFEVSGKTIALYGGIDSNFTSKFKGNRIVVKYGFDPSQLVTDDIIINSDDNFTVAENEFINKSTTPLRLFYGGTNAKFGKPNTYIGSIHDDGGKVNGDYQTLLIGLGDVLPTTSRKYDGILIPSIRQGDRVEISPMFETKGLIFSYEIITDGQLTIFVYNPTDTPIYVENNVSLNIERK